MSLKIGEYVYTTFSEAEELQQHKQSQSNAFIAGYITALARTVLY